MGRIAKFGDRYIKRVGKNLVEFDHIKTSDKRDNVPKWNSLWKITVMQITVSGCDWKIRSFDRFGSGIIGTGFSKIMGEIRPFAVRIQQVRGVFG